MLDEMLEFDEYTQLDKGKYPKRLTWGNINKGFSGIPRALTIIARHARYEENMNEDEINHLLNLWCGFESTPRKVISEKEKYKNICGWLPKYIKQLKPEKSKKTLDEIKKTRDGILEDLKENKYKWNRKVTDTSGSVNDKNSIYFEGIIADAINAGPLKKRYLVFKKDPTKGTTINKNKLFDGGFKLLVAFLDGQIENSDFSDVDFGAIANWIKTGASEGSKIKGLIKKIKYNIDGSKDAEIFELVHVQNKEEKFLHLNKKWIEDYGPRIILYEEIGNIENLDLVYVDKGCNKAMSSEKGGSSKL